MIKRKILIFVIVSMMLTGIANVVFWKQDDNHNFLLVDTSDIRGDVNGNGKIDSLDYVLVRKHILKLSLLSADKLIRADANSDGKVSSLDYVSIRKTIIGGNSNVIPTTNSKTIKATFIVQDNVGAKSSATLVSCTTSGSSCEIMVPTLTAIKNTTTVLGWNTDKNATTASVKSGNKVTISLDTNYYSITQTLVNVTFNVGEDIPGVNFKAKELSFYNNEHTRCISYNGNGCNIKWIPTIIYPGQVVHGFSKTPDGELINVAKTKYTDDTNLYARIYDYKNIGGISVNKYEIIGTVAVETEAGLPEDVTNRFMNFIRGLYRDFPDMLLWNGTLSLLTRSTYTKMYGSGSGGITTHGSSFSKDFSKVSLYYVYDTVTNQDFYLGNAVHEITHAFNYAMYWNGGMSDAISSTTDMVNFFNIHKNLPNRFLRDYAYTNSSEFFSELMREHYIKYRISRYNDYPYKSFANGWADDLTNAATYYHQLGINYYRSIGRF